MVLTLMGSLFEAVIDLLKHGLAASLKHGQYDALEGLFVSRLDGTLHGLRSSTTDSIRSVLRKE